MDSSSAPAAEYTQRLAQARQRWADAERRWAIWGNLRFAVFLAGVALLGLVLFEQRVAPAWLLLPVAVSVALSVPFEKARRQSVIAAGSIRYYERGLARLADRWAGTGIAGSEFVDESHLYAADLDLFGKGSLYERLCVACTSIGRQTLAHWLTTPATLQVLRERQQAIADLRDRLAWREHLALLGHDASSGIDTNALLQWVNELPAGEPSPWSRRIALALVMLSAALLLGWLSEELGLLPLLLALALQGGFARMVRPRVQAALHGVTGRSRDLFRLAGLLQAIEQETFHAPQLLQLQHELHSGGVAASQRLTELTDLVALLDSTRNTFFALVAPLVLWTTQAGLGVEAWRRRTAEALPRWLAVVGEFEALVSLAGYAYENPHDPFPELLEGEPLLEADELGHPLLPRSLCVRNAVRLNATDRRLLIVSGSNMSGKSTYLRAIGINTVLALAGGVVRAEWMRLTPLAIGATLRIQDSLQAGQSRFLAEITRLKHILEQTTEPLPVLYLLDEILHGTNSHDRRIGAEAILRRFLEQRTLGLVTTHDLALTALADRLPGVVNVHFADQLHHGQMIFDYRLRSGVVEHSNALELLRSIGLLFNPSNLPRDPDAPPFL